MSSNGLFDVAFERVGDMDIYLGCPDAVMSHKLLHNLQVCALLYKVRGKG